MNDILAANPEGLAVLAGIEEWPVHRRNTLRYVFCHPAARTLYPDWEATAQATVANLRARSVAASQSPDLAALVEDISTASVLPDFRGERGGVIAGGRVHRVSGKWQPRPGL